MIVLLLSIPLFDSPQNQQNIAEDKSSESSNIEMYSIDEQEQGTIMQESNDEMKLDKANIVDSEVVSYVAQDRKDTVTLAFPYNQNNDFIPISFRNIRGDTLLEKYNNVFNEYGSLDNVNLSGDFFSIY
ncbi:hypothetical protein LC087_06495 [Bacillus carboniphilus]|uniref:Uncharacterized protein n=1 Tax=Bacillus carboniphilus TaxID=86663 RepID=A0ABY9JWL1_9BACI|nr:hypothetical protein [Bacillus carboniphilus]WLR43774.1 hypothetical protein LC087_06495 [Bacillus carboniphilus]